SCHGSKNPKGKFDMTRFETFLKGGVKGDAVIVPGKPDDSYILTALRSTVAGRMPPRESGDALSAEQIATIERWIKEGAKLDTEVKPQADLVRELRTRWVPPQPPASYPYPVMVNALAFSPDNKKLVVGGHHELTVWDVESGKLEKRIRT